MRIAVTGASGFIGEALLRAARAAGHATIGLTRSERPLAHADRTVQYRALDDVGALARAFDGADAVVHLAARVHVMRAEGSAGEARFREANAEGTRSVLDAAIAAGVRRFVCFSTAKVHGEGGAGRVIREDDPIAPVGSYAESKAEGERLLRATPTGTIGWTIVRPPLVYGAGVGGNFRRLLSLAELGARVPLPLGGAENRRSLVAVENLVDLTLHALHHDKAIGQAFLVSDDEVLSTSDLVRRIGTALGRPVRLFTVPTRLLHLGLVAIGRRGESARLFDSFEVDGGAARRLLGWRAPLTVDAGLANVATWWRTRDAADA